MRDRAENEARDLDQTEDDNVLDDEEIGEVSGGLRAVHRAI